MKNSSKYLMLLIPTILLTSCGYSLRELYKGNEYNNTNFNLNFYEDKSDVESLTINNPNEKEYILNDAEDYVFKSLNDSNFKILDKKEYYHDNNVYINNTFESQPNYYGTVNKMSKIDNIFKYGMVSKLFDGILSCGGRHQAVRIQLNESGFAKTFTKQASNLDYFFMDFKAAALNENLSELPALRFNIDLKLSFYCKNVDVVNEYKFIYKDLGVIANNGDDYMQFGFKFDENKVDLTGLFGFKISYTLNGMDKRIRNADQSISYSKIEKSTYEKYASGLFLYEVVFANSTWH